LVICLLRVECRLAQGRKPHGAEAIEVLDIGPPQRVQDRGRAARASDIHIEPKEQGIAVRHRIDGALALANGFPARSDPPSATMTRPTLTAGDADAAVDRAASSQTGPPLPGARR
jgi:hypothetical protein